MRQPVASRSLSVLIVCSNLNLVPLFLINQEAEDGSCRMIVLRASN